MTVRRTAQVAIGLLCIAVVAVTFLPRSEPQKRAEESVRTGTVRQAGLVSAPAEAMAESGSRPLGLAKTPAVHIRPLFDPNLHIKLGETAMLKFVARDPVSERPVAPRAVISASVSNGRDPDQPLEVHEDGDGNYEVPFTPHGPGEFNVVLSADGIPTGSHKIGVIGAAGRTDALVDNVDPLSVDPRDFRARTGGQFHRR
jgi:hypothetical protein